MAPSSRIGCYLSVLTLAIFGGAGAAAAQDVLNHVPASTTLMGTYDLAEYQRIGKSPALNFNDIAYDDKHNVYLQVWGDAPRAWGRFVDATGTPVGAAFLLNPTGGWYGQQPRVAYSEGSSSDDVFFVSYATDSQSTDRAKNIYGQLVRFTGTGGTLVGSRFTIAQADYPAAYQTPGGVAFDKVNRRFVATWDDSRAWEIYIRLFDTAGAALTNEINISGTGTDQRAPNIAFDPITKRYIIVYKGESPTSSTSYGSWGRVYDANLAPITSTLTIGVGLHGEQSAFYLPAKGEWLVGWTALGTNADAVGRLVRTDGSFDGEIYPLVSTSVFDGVPDAMYSSSTNTLFLATMHDSGYLYGRELNANGVPMGNAFKASTPAPVRGGGTYWPQVAAGANGQFFLSYMLNYTSAWNERFEPLVPPVSPTLTVTVTGSGTVTSSAGGINCPGVLCSASYTIGTVVTLTATPASGWQLASWGGACNGTGTCQVTMNSAQNVTATFGQAPIVTPAALRFAAMKAGAAGDLTAVTSPQDVTVTFAGTSGAWTAVASQPWVQITNGAGTGAGLFTVGIINPANVIGASSSLTATITVTSSVPGLLSAMVPVALTVYFPATTVPFGAFDTPANGAANLRGSFAVTGWALDDIGVDRVELWRDKVTGETTPTYVGPGHPGDGKIFIANAYFVSGSRPDVEAAYPNTPFAQRAGWGYLLLSWGLYNQGNGPFTLYAFAFDKEGYNATLGSKTISVDNANAVKPFGAIDTPGPGATVSGSFWNYGWALTPNANPVCTITNGNVLMGIDSGPLVPVSYGDLRTDIAAAFPGYSNGNNSGGAYFLDTSTLTNGMHQIGWLVTDNCGRQDGVGSRFFTVLNSGTGRAARGTAGKSDLITAPSATADRVPTGPDSREPVFARQQAGSWQSLWPNSNGIRVIDVSQDGRIEVQLPAGHRGLYAAYQEVVGDRRALPVGSSLDSKAGVF